MVTHGSHMATPTRNLMDKSEELHGALLQLLLNTSGNDFEPDGVLVQALQLLSHACRPIKGDLGQSAPEQGENGATEVAELRRRLTDATERADAAEARMAQAERRREDAERERDECEENAARTLEEELAKASQTASAALEEANRSNRDAMEGLERAHQLQLNELRQQSKQAMADRKATSEDYERQAAHAKREQKLAEFRTKKLEEQKALDLRSEHQNASRLVHEAEEAAELAEQRVAYAESRQKQAEAQLARAQEDKLDAEERWRASINEANELRAQVRALKFEHNQVELGAIGSTSSADVARNMRRGQAMRLERQLAEAEQRASIEKQRAQGWERRHERMVAEVRASAAQLTQRNELVSQLQMELRKANIQTKELLDIAHGTSMSTGDHSSSANLKLQRTARTGQETGMTWRQLAQQVESVAADNVDHVASSVSTAVLLPDGTELSTAEALRTAKRQVAQLRGELNGERDAKHSLEDELAKRNREYEQLKLELPDLHDKFQELSSAEKASLDELAEAEERAISAEEEVLHRQQLLQILASEIDGIITAAEGDGAQHRADVVVSWGTIRRMHETLLSANLGARNGWRSSDGARDQIPKAHLHLGTSRPQPAHTWPSRVTQLHHRPDVTSGLTRTAPPPSIHASGLVATPGLPLAGQDRLSSSTPSLGSMNLSTTSNISGRVGFEFGNGLGGGAMVAGALSDGQRSTSAQAEKFRARLETAGTSHSKQSLRTQPPSTSSGNTKATSSQSAKPRPSIMEAMKASGLASAASASREINGDQSQSLHLSSSTADELARKVQAALQSAEKEIADGGSESRSNGAVGAIPARVAKDDAETAKKEAIRQRIKQQLKQAEDEAAATGT